MSNIIVKISSVANKISIKNRILVQFASIIMGVGSIIIFSYITNNQITDSIISVKERSVVQVKSINKIKDEMNQIQGLVYGYLSNQKYSPGELQGYKNKINKIVLHIKSELEVMKLKRKEKSSIEEKSTIQYKKLDKDIMMLSNRMNALVGNGLTLMETYTDKEATQDDKEFDFQAMQEIALMVNNEVNVVFDKFQMQVEKAAKQMLENMLLVKKAGMILALIAFTVIILITIGIVVSLTKPLILLDQGISDFFDFLSGSVKDVSQIEIIGNDEIAKMTNKINDKMTETRAGIISDRAMINETTTLIEKVKNGDYQGKIDSQPTNQELKELQETINELMNSLRINIGTDLTSILGVITKFSNMDFSNKVDLSDGRLEKAIDRLADIVSQVLKTNRINGRELSSNSEQLKKSFEELSISSKTQASSLEETASSIEEITGNIKSNTNKAQAMSEIANGTKNIAIKGSKSMEDSVLAMTEIDASTQNISKAIIEIEQIAFQTNILSLNAAVEAATAGEHGKGFAVVASEVRNLASKSAESAKQIKTLVVAAAAKTEQGRIISNDLHEDFKIMIKKITETVTMVDEVTQASTEQLVGMEQIAEAASSLDQLTQKSAQTVDMTGDIANAIAEIAEAIVVESEDKKFIE